MTPKRKKMTIVIRAERCVGCKSCELACAVAHSTAGNLYDAIQAGEKPGYRVNVEAFGCRGVPVHCGHCEDAVCVLACPTGAVHKDEKSGRVLIDGERCIGCRMCVQACPFGVIVMNPNGKGVLKCDMCAERLAKGDVPACVAACPTSALLFGSEEELARAKRRKAAENLVSANERSATE